MSAYASADPEQNVHFAAHVGTSFAIQTTAYGFNKKVLNMSKADAEWLAFAETMIIGSIYKVSERAPPGDLFRAEGENAIGIGLAIGVHYTFEF